MHTLGQGGSQSHLATLSTPTGLPTLVYGRGWTCEIRRSLIKSFQQHDVFFRFFMWNTKLKTGLIRNQPRDANPELCVKSMKLDLRWDCCWWSNRSNRAALYWDAAITRVRFPDLRRTPAIRSPSHGFGLRFSSTVMSQHGTVLIFSHRTPVPPRLYDVKWPNDQQHDQDKLLKHLTQDQGWVQ